MNISDAVRSHYHSLSAGKQKVGDYICAHKAECAYCSATELAKRVEVSNAQIVKFFKSIGFSSFKEMQLCIRDEIVGRQDLSAAGTLQKWQESETGNLQEDCMSIVNQDLLNIQNTMQNVFFERLNEAAAEIAKAGRVAFVGNRSTAGCNLIPSVYIAEMRENVFHFSPQNGNGSDILKWWTPNDLVVGVRTYKSGSEFIHEMLDIALKRGCKTIVFTDSETYIQMEDKGYDFVFQYATENALVSYTSLLVLYNVLDCLVAQNLGSEAVQNIWKSEQLLYGNPLPGGE